MQRPNEPPLPASPLAVQKNTKIRKKQTIDRDRRQGVTVILSQTPLGSRESVVVRRVRKERTVVVENSCSLSMSLTRPRGKQIKIKAIIKSKEIIADQFQMQRVDPYDTRAKQVRN